MLLATVGAAGLYAASIGASMELQKAGGKDTTRPSYVVKHTYEMAMRGFYGVQGAWIGSALGIPPLLTGNVPGAVVAGGGGAVTGFGIGWGAAGWAFDISDSIWGEGGPFGLWELLP